MHFNDKITVFNYNHIILRDPLTFLTTMKSFLLMFVLIVSSECGLLDDVLSSKDQKSKSESDRKEYRQGVLLKVGETLKNGTKIVIDALGNIIKIHPDGKEEIIDSKGNPQSPSNNPVKDNEIVRKDDENKPALPKQELPKNDTADKVKVEPPKTDDNLNKTLTTKPDVDTKDAAKAGDVKDAPNTPKIDENTVKNCEVTNDEACMKVANRTFLKGDECPTGKSRADDGTCVPEI